MSAPKWMLKHPCDACGAGYGMCAQHAASGFKCCKDCAHPTRWEPNPYTDEDRAEWEAADK